ncbi:DddA-like double-stranded DNA deaminase toxin [Actinoallomurus liliacearum]
MRENGIRSTTLVVNHIPCDDGPLSCDRLIPQILPAGSTMTVHGADGLVRSYQGGAAT